jgi:hypothetical protein
MPGLIDGFREWTAPASGVGDNPFKLACSVWVLLVPARLKRLGRIRRSMLVAGSAIVVKRSGVVA